MQESGRAVPAGNARLGDPLLVGAGGAGAAAPNGVEDRTASQILAAVLQAVDGATAVHVVGSWTSDGEMLSLNLRLLASKVGECHISISELGFDVVRIGGKSCFKGDKAFLTRARRRRLCSPGGGSTSPGRRRGFADFAQLTDLVSLVDDLGPPEAYA